MTFRRSNRVERERKEWLEEVQRDFQRTFATPEGQRALAHMAFMFCAFTDKQSHEGQHPEWRQVFYWILDQMGTNDAENIFDIVKAISHVTPVKPVTANEIEDDPLGDDDEEAAEWRGRSVG